MSINRLIKKTDDLGINAKSSKLIQNDSDSDSDTESESKGNVTKSRLVISHDSDPDSDSEIEDDVKKKINT